MNDLNTIVISITTLFLSAYLAYFFGNQSVRSKEKNEEKKKLKKLLFHLLIVRKAESDRARMDALKENIKKQFKSFFIDKIGMPENLVNDEMTNEIINSQWHLVENLIEKRNTHEIDLSKQSIKLLVTEFSEINPLFALLLKNHEQNERKDILPNLFNAKENDKDINLFRNAIIPVVEQKLIFEIDEIINETTSKIDRKIHKQVQELLIEYDKVEIDPDEYNDFMNELIINPLQQKLNDESIQS